MNLLAALKTPAARIPRSMLGVGPIVDFPDPEVVAIPLEYPHRLVLPPVVQVGDVVARHQVIGRSELGNCLHASIGGKVREIRRIWTSLGHQVPAVIIDRGDVPDLTPAEGLAGCGIDPLSATRVQLLKSGGVISPWTTPGKDHAERDTAASPEIKHVVILGYNEEPTPQVQELLLQEYPAVLKDGLRLLRDVAPQARFTLVVARQLMDWAEEVFGEGLQVVGVADQYYRRLERPLVNRVTGLVVPAGASYRSQGIAVMSVETALAAQDALVGKPQVRKSITVSGAGLDHPRTLRVALGTSVKTILESCGLEFAGAGRVLAGGPMKGMALFSEDTPVDKFLEGIHVLAPDELPAEVNLNCVNCGRCTRACPVNLQVHLIGRCVEFDLLGTAVEFHPEACLECGLCAFVCPARRPLVQLVKLAQAHGRKAS